MRTITSTIQKCIECSSQFPVWNHRIGERKFCSRKCYLVSHANRPKIRNKCLTCSAEVISRPSEGYKFCNHTCQQKYRWLNPVEKMKQSERSKKLHRMGVFPYQSPPWKGKTMSMKFKEKVSEGMKKYRKTLSKEERKEIIMRLMRRKIPTEIEKKFIKICEKNNFPFKYVGDGELWIGGKNPDFIHKSKRKIIEIAGSYWHDKNYEKERISYFDKYGYSTMVVWDHELKNTDEIVNKMKMGGFI